MPTDAYLGLDLGTSSLKALLVDEDGRTLAAANERIELVSERPLQAEQDADAWWDAAVPDSSAV